MHAHLSSLLCLSYFSIRAPLPPTRARQINLVTFADGTGSDDRLVSLRKQLESDAFRGYAEAKDLVSACDGLDRGAAASAEDAARVASLAASFEEAAPCRLQGNDLIESFSGKWVLVYNSALVSNNRAGRLLVQTSRPSIGEVSQTLRGSPTKKIARLDEEVQLTIPAPFPLPKQELRLVFSQSFRTAREGPGHFRVSVDALNIYRSDSSSKGRGVTLPSPRGVLKGLMRQFGRVFPLELTLLSELVVDSPGAAMRSAQCTAALLRGAPSVRVVRDAGGDDFRVFVAVDVTRRGSRAAAFKALQQSSSETAAPAAALPAGGGLAAADGDGGADRLPVGQVDANGEPIEEFWVEGRSGFDDQWLGYEPVPEEEEELLP